MNDIFNGFEQSVLYSVRYGETLQNAGMWDEGSCKNVTPEDRSKLAAVLEEYSQPVLLYPNRYDSYNINTDAMYIALEKLNQIHGTAVVELNSAGLFGNRYTDKLKDLYTPFLFDLIEIQAFALTSDESSAMAQKINEIFSISHLPFALSDKGMIEQIIEYEVLDKTTDIAINAVSEDGLRDLLNAAVSLHRKPDLSSHRDAVEKIWDALERLKTYYTALDKKSSAARIVDDMANKNSDYTVLFNDEFAALTKIGNNYRIRHHETDKIDISDIRYYDYFFNRCLSLVALAIQYLQ